MLRRWFLFVLGTMAAAAVIGASAGAHTQHVVLPPAHVSTSTLVKKILASHGIDPKGVVIQHGVWNYAGPSCPGIGWTCTTAKRVVQFSAKDSNNQFQCSASNAFGGSATAPGDCTIVQVSSSGNNVARCVEKTQSASGVSQSCLIFQTSTTGSNQIEIQQQVNGSGGPSQDATQYAGASQQSDSGRNDTRIDQQLSLQTKDAGPGGTQTQTGYQTVSVDQESNTGDNSADVHQSLGLQAQIAGSGHVPVVVNQGQDASDNGPNTNGAIVQHSGSGKNDARLNQSNDLNAQAPNNATGSQVQGTQGGGLNGHFDQLSTGVSTNHGEQHEHQQLSPDHPGAGLSQDQVGPMWMGSPQGSNQNDQYNVKQQSEQHAGNSAFQQDDAYGNCDTSGNCNVDQHINQNGNSQKNSCSGPQCHIGLLVTSGGEGGGTETCTGMGEGGCPPPPPPPPPPDPCFFEECSE